MSHAFIIHAGGREVTLDEIHKAETPDCTGTHFPIDHGKVVDYTRSTLETCGLTVSGERHALWDEPYDTTMNKAGRSNMRYFGLMTLKHPGLDGWEPAIALRNSHDKAFSLQESFGNNVLVCDNLLLTGVILAMHKHTRNAWEEFKARLVEAVQIKVVRGIDQMIQRVECYEKTKVSDMDADRIIMEAYRRKILSSSKIGKVHDVYHSDEQREMHGAYTVNAMLNSFTEVMKGTVMAYPRKSYALTGMLDDIAGVPLGADL